MSRHRRKCKSCGATIVWATNHKGAHVPYNVKRTTEPHGAYVIEEIEDDLLATPVSEIDEDLAKRFPWTTSHFATCPDAEKWRKS